MCEILYFVKIGKHYKINIHCFKFFKRLRYNFPGLKKIGVITALINTNLKMEPLIHSVLSAAPKMLLVGTGQFKEYSHSILELVKKKFSYMVQIGLEKMFTVGSDKCR